MPGSAVNPTLDIIDTILAEDSFKTFLGALQTAGMIDKLKSAGPFTVLAPIDQAFEKLPAGTVSNLEKPENSVHLIQLLERHIIKGVHTADDLRQRMSIAPVTGEPYSIVASGDRITIGSARLLAHPIACTNGMIHVIDAVLS